MEDKFEVFVKKVAGMNTPMAFKTCKNAFALLIAEAKKILKDSEPILEDEPVSMDIHEVTPLVDEEDEKEEEKASRPAPNIW